MDFFLEWFNLLIPVTFVKTRHCILHLPHRNNHLNPVASRNPKKSSKFSCDFNNLRWTKLILPYSWRKPIIKGIEAESSSLSTSAKNHCSCYNRTQSRDLTPIIYTKGFDSIPFFSNKSSTMLSQTNGSSNECFAWLDKSQNFSCVSIKL